MKTLITTHARADFDAFASVLAAQKLYPGSAALLPGLLNTNVQNFLNLYRDFLPIMDKDDLAEFYARLVLVDTRQRERVEHAARFIDDCEELHIYDHHPPQDDDLQGDREVVENVGAATTLLVEEIREREIALSELEATIMALGIYEDTGGLAFKTTTRRDVDAFAFLWETGINNDIVQEFFLSPLTPEQKTLLEEMVSRSEFREINQRRILISQAASPEYIHGLAELLYRISSGEEVEAAFCLVQMNDRIHFLGRSFREDLDLLEIFSFWSVKGHSSAVFASLKEQTLEGACRELKEALERDLAPPLRAADVASAPVKTIGVGTRVSVADKMMEKYGHSGLVVMDEDKIAGVISRKDLYKARRHRLEHAPVKAFMSRQVITASPEDSITHLRRLMMDHNIGRLPLVDEEGQLVGIVTRKDVLRSLYQLEVVRKETYREKLADAESLHGDAEKFDLAHMDDLTLLMSRKLPAEIQKLLFAISREAEEEGCQVYLVGGCIRDLMMGYSIPEDLDLAVVPDALDFARRLKDKIPSRLQVFEPFGTASLFLQKGMRLDLVTARREFYAEPASLPQVEASSLKDDLYRRDFTINTLACSLNVDTFGRLYDFFGGRRDLQEGIIRVLYQLSFVDDPLRILRAVRFEQRFGFQMEEETQKLLIQAVQKRTLKKVSRGRLNAEARLVFFEPDPPAVLKRLDELDVLTVIFPGIRLTPRRWEMMDKTREVLRWAKKREWPKTPDPEVTYLSALFYGLSPEKIRFLGYRLGFSREKVGKMVTAALALPEVHKELENPEIGPAKVFQLLDPLPVEALLLLKVLAHSSPLQDYPELYWDNLRKVQPTLRGSHLREMGLPPGPVYGEVLDKLKKAILEGEVRSEEEEREFVAAYVHKIKEGHDSLSGEETPSVEHRHNHAEREENGD